VWKGQGRNDYNSGLMHVTSYETEPLSTFIFSTWKRHFPYFQALTLIEVWTLWVLSCIDLQLNEQGQRNSYWVLTATTLHRPIRPVSTSYRVIRWFPLIYFDLKKLNKRNFNDIVLNVISKARFPLAELTARVDGWPVSITRQHGPSTRLVETGLKQ